ncbi:unnamed protein product [Caenorhabditis sp. 36 PRJEB53466]|nr:unnamed protein product [Caenorhabditis sp. 36 PRJEB53466]
MSARWLMNLSFRAEKFGVLLASVSNSTLLYMLFFKASTSFGAYKHLMICYTIIEMLYSLISLGAGMAAHSTDFAYVVFQMNSGFWGRSIAPIFLVDFCGIYFVLLLILAVHFIYRYFVVCDSKKVELFDGCYLVFWIVVPIVFGCAQAALKMIMFAENEYLTDALREPFLLNYNLTMEQIVYNGPIYYVCNSVDECEKPLAPWITMIWITFSLAVCLCIMSFCCHRTLVKLGRKEPHASIRTVELQKQLMTALVIQSVIPICLMYIPIVFLFTSPMFGVSFGPYVNLTMATLAIYPPVDQFAILYVIKDFRTAIRKFFCRSADMSSPQSSVAVFSSKFSI